MLNLPRIDVHWSLPWRGGNDKNCFSQLSEPSQFLKSPFFKKERTLKKNEEEYLIHIVSLLTVSTISYFKRTSVLVPSEAVSSFSHPPSNVLHCHLHMCTWVIFSVNQKQSAASPGSACRSQSINASRMLEGFSCRTKLIFSPHQRRHVAPTNAAKLPEVV